MSLVDAARLREYLKSEFGIGSQEEFDMAVSKMKGVNLGIFTVPVLGGKENDQKAKKEAAALC